MLFPTLLALFSVALVANAVPQFSPNPHAFAAFARDVTTDCPACTSFTDTVSGCVQLTDTTAMGTCLCNDDVINNLNTCLQCPDIIASDTYADLIAQTSQLTSVCQSLGITGLPAINTSLPADTAAPSTTAAATDPSSPATSDDAGIAPTTTTAASNTAATAALTTTRAAGATTTKAASVGTVASASKIASASASVVATTSDALKSRAGSIVLASVAGVVGVLAMSI